jgi:hypothetical protein
VEYHQGESGSGACAATISNRCGDTNEDDKYVSEVVVDPGWRGLRPTDCETRGTVAV